MPAMTRGPLPARVYWVRRLIVLGVALLLVFGIARLLGGGSDASSGSDRATQVAADASPDASTPQSGTRAPLPSGSPNRPGKGKGKAGRASEQPALAEPEGTCADEDVAVTPEIEGAVAGRDVTIVLQLRTLESEACTWRVSHDSLTVKITSGKDDIWSSLECPRAIPVRDVVVRKAVTTNVGITWNQAKRSGEACTLRTEWAEAGWYHVTAAALGGEPSDLQFELVTPTAATITKTASPSNSPSNTPSGRPVTQHSESVKPD
jgi:hypothetical protein